MRAWGTGLLVAGLSATFLGSGTASAQAGAAEVPDGELPFVAKVLFGDLRSCTGTLVSAKWIVTAKSCFSDGTGPVVAGTPTRPATVLLGRADLTKVSGNRLLVTTIVPQPDRDIALAELSAPVKGITPVSLDGAAPQAGETLRIAGYGRTTSTWVPDRMHADTFTVDGIEDASFGVTGTSTSATLCKGDAGGPAFRETDGKVELVGITEASAQKGCIGEPETALRDGGTESRADALAGWIRGVLGVQQPSALREPVFGDFNRDGRTDLLAADIAGALWLHPGTATPGAWGPRVKVGTGWQNYRELAVGKVNRDAYDDLVTIETATGKLWMYPGQATGGAFGTRVQIGSGWTPYRDLVIGKVNHDQYDDLLTVNNDDGRLMLYTGNAAGGNFNAAVQYGSSWGCCKQLTLGKFNSDDYADLITVDSGTGKLRLYAGNAAAANFNAAIGVNDTATWNLSSAVFGCMVVDSVLDVMLEVETATGRTWLHTRTAAGGWNARIAPAGTIQGPGPEEMSDLVSGEFTRDGSTDLIGTDSAGYLWLYPGTAAKTFGPRRLIGSGWQNYRELTIGRVNRDAFDDLVTIETATGKLWMYPGTAGGYNFGTRVQIGAGWTPYRDLVIGKINRDEYDDLLTVNGTSGALMLYAGNATGPTFNAGVQYGSGWACCKELTLGHFNADDYVDLLTVDTTGKLRLYAGNETAATFNGGIDSGAGTGWTDRKELTSFTFGGDQVSSLLAQNTDGSVTWYRPLPGTGIDFSDPVVFGPRG